MPLVATLISHPKKASLSHDLAQKTMRALGASAVDWLAEGVACDIEVVGGPGEADALQRLREMLAGLPVDAAVQPSETRRKRMLIADMDSTMIDQECIDELADEIGIKDHVAAITARAMNGELAFEPALRERVALLEGLESAIVARVIAERITLASGGRALVATMRKQGAVTALVSGGFDVFTGPIAEKLGFEVQSANRLMEAEGRLTGKVVEPILGRAAKAEALRTIAAKNSLAPADAIAVGDGANDLDMIALAGTGVALHAKPAVAEQARIRIDHGDLTALLYLQGYRRAEFVE